MTEQTSLHIGLLQSQLSWSDPAKNRSHLESLLTAHMPEADVLVIPETFTTGFLGDSGTPVEGMEGPTVEWMKDLADRHQCVLTGSAVIDSGAGRVNRLLWVEPGGGLSFYDKRHLFSYAGEDRRYVAGGERVIIDYRGWRICPQVCYDIRFPVWCRNRNDYDMLLVVANWPKPRIAAWTDLLKARAIENQCYVAAVNRVGEDGRGNLYNGQSVLRGPSGEPVLKLGEEEACATAEIDLASVTSLRRDLPFHADADTFRICDP